MSLHFRRFGPVATAAALLSSSSGITSAASLPELFSFSFGADRASIETTASQAGLPLDKFDDGQRVWTLVTMPQYLGLTIPQVERPFWAMFGFDEDGGLEHVRLNNQDMTKQNWCDDGSFAQLIKSFETSYRAIGTNPKEEDYVTLPVGPFIGEEDPTPEDKVYVERDKSTTYRYVDAEDNILAVMCSRRTWNDRIETFVFQIDFKRAEGTPVD